MNILKHCKAQHYIIFHEATRAVQLCYQEFRVLHLTEHKTLTQKLLVESIIAITTSLLAVLELSVKWMCDLVNMDENFLSFSLDKMWL